ncbi:hypothetical protein BU14_0023s0003 [Porphyra umbilicalis]|uniref:Uncharacterized protein n=1 Tax=Porphyra umbilicalis TaxID=2786 RepID=A0A1X6PKG4_PORUM|nr:hypothetical protein BU14_0023s0003 [Porphyra umbilicalis]|eukprot:OSX81198.1 hypothetical protein BU14_0023s0003 [Porphyra umbilicalis]
MGGRRPALVAMLGGAFLAAGAFGVLVGKFRPSADAPRRSTGRLVAAAVLAGVYRALTLGVPAVGPVIEGAMVGPPDGFPARRDGALATFYVANRVGTIFGGLVILCVPGRKDALPFLASSAAAGLATLAINAVALRPPPPLPPPPTAEEMAAMGETEADPPPPTSVTAHVVADLCRSDGRHAAGPHGPLRDGHALQPRVCAARGGAARLPRRRDFQRAAGLLRGPRVDRQGLSHRLGRRRRCGRGHPFGRRRGAGVQPVVVAGGAPRRRRPLCRPRHRLVADAGGSARRHPRDGHVGAHLVFHNCGGSGGAPVPPRPDVCVTDGGDAGRFARRQPLGGGAGGPPRSGLPRRHGAVRGGGARARGGGATPAPAGGGGGGGRGRCRRRCRPAAAHAVA